MNSKKLVVIALAALILVLGAGTVTVFLLNQSKENAKQTEMGEDILTEEDLKTLSAWTDCEIYQDIPAMEGKNIKVGEADDYGNKNYVLDVNGTTIEDYKDYVEKLQKAGFKKHSDNGEGGMEGYVYTTSFQKDKLTLVVSHVASLNKTYLSATNGLALSPYLNYDSSWSKGVSADAKTKVHMLELNNNGNSIVIQLKNGHYVLHDGGTTYDAPYLMDYLEELTPGEEKPVIEAWFISHAHVDHYGAFHQIRQNDSYRERLIVKAGGNRLLYG